MTNRAQSVENGFHRNSHHNGLTRRNDADLRMTAEERRRYLARMGLVTRGDLVRLLRINRAKVAILESNGLRCFRFGSDDLFDLDQVKAALSEVSDHAPA